MILKPVLLIVIIAVAMIGVMVPSAFAQSDVIFGENGNRYQEPFSL